MAELIDPTKRHFNMSKPKNTHTRPATCLEVNCPPYLNGWDTIVPTNSDDAEYIRHDVMQRFTEYREGPLSRFRFPAGQGIPSRPVET